MTGISNEQIRKQMNRMSLTAVRLTPSLADALGIGQLGVEQTEVVETAIRAPRSVANK